MKTQEMRIKAHTIRTNYNDLMGRTNRHENNLKTLTQLQIDIVTASRMVSECAQKAQLHFGGIVSGVVTQCLNSVYPSNPYTFKVEFRESAGKTVADTLLYRDGEAMDPLSSTGGGVWDVLAFSLRVALLVLTARKDTRKLLVVDEPFKFLHGAEMIRRAYETLESVAEQFKLTVLCVRQHDSMENKLQQFSV